VKANGSSIRFETSHTWLMIRPESSEVLQTFLAVSAVSAASLIGAATFTLGKRFQSATPYLLSSASGALIASGLCSLLPEALERNRSFQAVGLLLGLGFLFSFLLERLSDWALGLQHSEDVEHLEAIAEQQATSRPSTHPAGGLGRSLITNLLVSGAVHSFVDGIGIAVAFAAGHTAGVATTTAVILHEVPHHMANVAVMVAGGLGRARAIVLNLLVTSACAAGACLVLLFGFRTQSVVAALLPLTAGNFLYIAVGLLMPELQRERSRSRSIWQVTTLVLTFALVGILSFAFPESPALDVVPHR
jgi:zinc and cadmium transporter